MTRPKNRGVRCDRVGFCDFRQNYKGAPATCTDRRGPCYRFMVQDIERKERGAQK